jgi:hypothetical protein
MGFKEDLQAVLRNGREEDLTLDLRTAPTGSFAVCEIFDTPAKVGLGGYYGSTLMTIEYARRHTMNEEQAQQMMKAPNEKKIRVLYTIAGGLVIFRDIKRAKVERQLFKNLIEFKAFLIRELQLPISTYYDRACNYRTPGYLPFVDC